MELKNLKKIILTPVTIGIISGFGVTHYENKLVNHIHYVDKNIEYIRRGDGILSYTQLTKIKFNDYVEEKVEKRSLFSSETYYNHNKDTQMDNLVDKIEITGPRLNGVTGTLIRKDHYNKFKNEFDIADKIFNDTKNDFKL